MRNSVVIQLATASLVAIILIACYRFYEYAALIFDAEYSNTLDPTFYMFAFFTLGNFGLLAWGLVGLSHLLNRGTETKGLRFLRVYVFLLLLPMPFNIASVVSLLSSSEGEYWLRDFWLFYLQLAAYLTLAICLWLLYRQRARSARIDLSSATVAIKPVSRVIRFLNLFFDTIFHFVVFSQLMNGLSNFLSFGVYRSSFTLALIFYAFQVLAYSWTEGIFGQSIGKTITGSQVFFDKRVEFPFMSVLGRSLIRLVPFDFLSVFSPDRQMWHDEWSSTAVLEAPDVAATTTSDWSSELLDESLLKG